jgi:hypothetical protein
MGLGVTVVALLAIVGSACGDDDDSGGSAATTSTSTTTTTTTTRPPESVEVASPEELAELVIEAGFECTDLQPSESFSEDEDGASCATSEGDELFLVKYTDAEAVRTGIAAAEMFVCDPEFGQPGNSVSFAVGPNWTVTAPTEARAQEIAGALGGEVETITC